MKPKLLLRIAALLMLLHTLGHTMGTLQRKKAPNPAIAQDIARMQNDHFPFMGREASLWAFYEGYALSMIAVLLFVSLLLWLLSSAPHPILTRLTGIFLVALGVVEYVYFFPLAGSFTFLAGICALLAAAHRMYVSDRAATLAKCRIYPESGGNIG